MPAAAQPSSKALLQRLGFLASARPYKTPRYLRSWILTLPLFCNCCVLTSTPSRR